VVWQGYGLLAVPYAYCQKFRLKNTSVISKTQQAQGLLISIELFGPPIGAKLHTH